MTDSSGVNNTLLEAFIQLILMQKDFVSRIINLATNKIQTIEDVLKVSFSAIGIIIGHFKQLKDAFLSVEWYYHIGFAL